MWARVARALIYNPPITVPVSAESVGLGQILDVQPIISSLSETTLVAMGIPSGSRFASIVLS